MRQLVSVVESEVAIIKEIKEIKNRLDKIEKELTRLLAEKEEAELIPDGEYQEITVKAEYLRKYPEEDLSIEEAVKELTSDVQSRD